MGSVYNVQVENLRARGLQFLDVPDKYYTNLKERLKQSPVKVKEDIDVVRDRQHLADVENLRKNLLIIEIIKEINEFRRKTKWRTV